MLPVIALVLSSFLVALTSSQVQYPAHVSPHQCPNYPYCSYHIPAEAYHPRKHYNHHQSAYTHHRHAFHAQPAKYPPGVHPAACPNYPYCGVGHHEAAHHYRAASHHTGYPAGVNPSTCPNYPYCF